MKLKEERIPISNGNEKGERKNMIETEECENDKHLEKEAVNKIDKGANVVSAIINPTEVGNVQKETLNFLEVESKQEVYASTESNESSSEKAQSENQKIEETETDLLEIITNNVKRKERRNKGKIKKKLSKKEMNLNVQKEITSIKLNPAKEKELEKEESKGIEVTRSKEIELDDLFIDSYSYEEKDISRNGSRNNINNNESTYDDSSSDSFKDDKTHLNNSDSDNKSSDNTYFPSDEDETDNYKNPTEVALPKEASATTTKFCLHRGCFEVPFDSNLFKFRSEMLDNENLRYFLKISLPKELNIKCLFGTLRRNISNYVTYA